MNFHERSDRFHSYNAWLKERFGGRVAKLSLDLGMPCIHRTLHPPGCAYCRPGVIMADRIGALGSVTAQIDEGLLRVGKRYETDLFLAYFQNETPTAGDLVWLLDRYDEALKHPGVLGMILSTRPDCLPEELLDALAERSRTKPIFLELGLQSMWDETLVAIGRGHDVACFKDALTRARSRDFPVAAHMILGLPGETPESMEESFRLLSGLPVDSVKIHHLQVYPGAPLEAAWRRGDLRIFERFEDYLDVLVPCLEVLPWRIKVQRVVADAPSFYTLAPNWGLNKNEVLYRLARRFEERGSRQGSRAEKEVIDVFHSRQA